jgi:hypothetical protein|tara:strand:+ start:629 stop:1012 length:384 start_codon:yes stop_codon:yes gene_type:complete
MALYDYKCEDGHITEDVYATMVEGPAPTITCSCCQNKAFRYYGNHQFLKVSDTSSMYGTYHPGFGQVVEDYAHKNRLLKQYDVIEAADAVHGSRCHRIEKPEAPRAPDDSAWLTADQVTSMGGDIPE